ncbi:MAG: hypothetical protein AAGJ87_01170 [Pseudomonadota bacterium]
MGINIFSIVGGSLGFGARRMETIMRVAWLPVVLLLILNMATLFAYVSLAAGRLISFDAAVPNMATLQYYAERAVDVGWERSPAAMAAITGGSLALQFILVASFMAPLIRFAGLGERPGPGVVRVPFGPDQLRFIVSIFASFLLLGAFVLGPAFVAAAYVVDYVNEAYTTVFVSFPDAASLHTIELVSGKDVIASRGDAWRYDLAAPALAAAPFAFLLWIVLTAHFHPNNRAPSPSGDNLFLRALGALLGAGFLAALFFPLAAANGGTGVIGILIAAVIALFYYGQLRFAPFPGVAVCRKSLSLKGFMNVTRGWNLLRLFIAIAILLILLFAAQVIINTYVVQAIAWTINALFQAIGSYTEIIGRGEQAGWVIPVFSTAWSVIKILINVFWTFFTYGVFAGFLGRLYRESEAAEV